ncbi:efflux RND transporter periplasmic adaptor subunit [Candidatus Dependentiae bacterium]|nr:efflux RND transporter periplasmic adaptor subunit [Candidatus Dependentiae bacterium]
MNIKHFIAPSLLFLSLIIIIWFGYLYFFSKPDQDFFTIGKAQKRTITQIIKATGSLKVEDSMRIGSIVPGVIQKMYVEENEEVKKGHLLASIDDGNQDTLVRSTHAIWESSQAVLKYQKAFYGRQRILYEHNHISRNDFDQFTQNYEIAVAQEKRRKAEHERALLEFNNKQIKAPDDGLVVEKVSREGETVTLASPATIIYILARDITKMEAKLEIDESTVGMLKKNMEAHMTFDTYPNQVFNGPITDISNAPKTKNEAVSYNATVYLDNTERLFRHGMTVNAEIIVAEKQNVLSVPGNIFKISQITLEQIAQAKGFAVQALSQEEKIRLKRAGNMKTVWLVKGKNFVEHSVQVGVNDNAFFEIVKGLTGQEDLIFDTAEPNVMEEFFERFFGKGL